LLDLGAVKSIVAGENLEACTLLADQFWNDQAAQTDGELVAAVPSRSG